MQEIFEVEAIFFQFHIRHICLLIPVTHKQPEVILYYIILYYIILYYIILYYIILYYIILYYIILYYIIL